MMRTCALCSSFVEAEPVAPNEVAPPKPLRCFGLDDEAGLPQLAQSSFGFTRKSSHCRAAVMWCGPIVAQSAPQRRGNPPFPAGSRMGTPSTTLGPMRLLLVDPASFTPQYDHELASSLVRAGAEVELLTS